MDRFSEMRTEDVIKVINKSKGLRDMLDRRIQQCEMDYISDKLNEFDGSAIDYSIDPWDYSYFKVKDNDAFVEGVKKSYKDYSLAEETEKLLQRCEELKDTDSYGKWVEVLRQSYYKNEIESVLKGIQECSFELYCGSIGEQTKGYVDNFVDNYLGDYLWDEDSKTYYKPYKVSE